MSKDVVTDIEEAFKAASEEASTEDSSTDDASEEQEDEKSESSDQPRKGKDATSRIKHLVAEQKKLEEQLNKTKSTLSERDSELGKLVDLLQSRENDTQVVSRLNELYHNPDHKPFIEYIDKLVRGEEAEVPEFSSKKVQKDAEKSVDLIKKLDEKAQEINSAIADQQAEVILQQADRYATDVLSELPEEYSDEDKKIISKVVVDNIDWDAIEADNGRNLFEEVQKGFNATLEWYGHPKGLAKLIEKGEQEIEKDPEEESRKLRAFIDQDWGKMKSVEKGNKKSYEPAVSDQDFAKALGKLLKSQNT